MHHYVTEVTAVNHPGSYTHQQFESAKLRLPGIAPERQREPVMTRTILISITAFFLIAGAWTINLVTYHPATDQGLNPLSPATLTVGNIGSQPPA
jgi:hypothetical protein